MTLKKAFKAKQHFRGPGPRNQVPAEEATQEATQEAAHNNTTIGD